MYNPKFSGGFFQAAGLRSGVVGLRIRGGTVRMLQRIGIRNIGRTLHYVDYYAADGDCEHGREEGYRSGDSENVHRPDVFRDVDAGLGRHYANQDGQRYGNHQPRERDFRQLPKYLPFEPGRLPASVQPGEKIHRDKPVSRRR